jgi:hypothetical protein
VPPLSAVAELASSTATLASLHEQACVFLHQYFKRYGIMMMELALALAVGFALGYGVREWVSRQRRRAFGRQRR